MNSFLSVDLSSNLNYKKVGPVKEVHNLVAYRTESGNDLLNPIIYPKPKETIEIASIPFTFPGWEEDTYDTVCCEGQIINVPANKYLSYNIIGNCNFSYFKEKVFFHTVNAAKIEAELVLYRNWRGARGFELEYNNSSCSFALLTKSMSKCPLGIYRYSANVPDADEFINAIELPFNPNMFIFSITLGY